MKKKYIYKKNKFTLFRGRKPGMTIALLVHPLAPRNFSSEGSMLKAFEHNVTVYTNA